MTALYAVAAKKRMQPPKGKKPTKRDDLTEKILDTKRVSGMSWEDIAGKIGGCSPIADLSFL